MNSWKKDSSGVEPMPNEPELNNPTLDSNIVDALSSCSQFELPANFLFDTLTKFDSAHKAKVANAWVVGLLSTFLIATPTVWFVLLNLKDVTKILAVCIQLSAVGFEFLVTIWNSLPEFGTGIMLSLWVILFLCTISLIKVFKFTLTEENALS